MGRNLSFGFRGGQVKQPPRIYEGIHRVWGRGISLPIIPLPVGGDLRTKTFNNLGFSNPFSSPALT